MMNTYFLKVCYAVLLLLSLLHTAGSLQGYNLATTSEEVMCIENEKQALLNFKQSLVDKYDMLSSWRDDHNNRDCCKWRGVECSNETGHVHRLRLLGSKRHYLSGVINITSLIVLQNMEYFDFSSNNFIGNQIPKNMGSLSNLRYLILSYMSFGGRIPYQIGNLSQLAYLDLKGNHLVGAIPSQLGKLTHLLYLDLGGNYGLDGEIPYQLGNLSRLKYFDLEGNYISKPIPFQVGNLSVLQTLRLEGNFDLKINGAEWLYSLSSLTNLDFSYLRGPSNNFLQIIRKLLPKLRFLRLSECQLSDNDIHSLFDSHSNFSTSLTILDLSNNMLTSSTFQLLSNFSLNLHTLYLSHNNIALSNPPSLSFPSLVILDLSYNNLTSSVFHGDANFSSKLEYLYLQNSGLLDNSFLIPSHSIINSSSSLLILDLSSNLLTSSAIFTWLVSFTSNLHTLHLHDNLLECHIPNDFFKEMNSLEHLDLNFNQLQGEVPTFLGNICTLDLSNNQITGLLPNLSIVSPLWYLDLSNNHLNGEIPKSIGMLNELESLYLEGNSFEGDITELHINNLSNLENFDLSDNSLSLKFGNSWVPPFQLLVLGLASCKLGPSFPSWLQTQRYLTFIDISNAGINDSVPVWFWNKLQSVTDMNMSCNNLIGTIPNLPLKLTNVEDEGNVYVLSSNQFEGEVPDFLLQTSILDLSKNKISDLNTFLCGKSTSTNLHTLDLSDNQINGELPDCWGHLNSLNFLDLSNNKLSGKIPSSMSALVYLQVLVLRNNSFTGELPSTLKNCTYLYVLDVGENLFSGSIPSWIGENLQELKILSLRVNHFFGTLPSELCYLRQIHLFDLSGNNLSGSIPTCLENFTTMVDKSMDLSVIVKKRLLSTKGGVDITYESNALLTWKGQEYVFKNPMLLLKSIDLSSNHFSGEMLVEFGQLLGLISLNLSRNNLSGEIPSNIGNLNSLEFLDLSRNHFSNRIPSTLSQIDRLAVLDLSSNSLYGKIPLGTQLQSFDPSSFEGNLNLCGKPLEKICPEDETPMKPQGPAAAHDTDDNSIFYEALYMSMGIGFFTGFWGLIGPLLFWRPWRNSYVRFLNKLTDYGYVMVVLNVARCRRWLNR